MQTGSRQIMNAEIKFQFQLKNSPIATISPPNSNSSPFCSLSRQPNRAFSTNINNKQINSQYKKQQTYRTRMYSQVDEHEVHILSSLKSSSQPKTEPFCSSPPSYQPPQKSCFPHHRLAHSRSLHNSPLIKDDPQTGFVNSACLTPQNAFLELSHH